MTYETQQPMERTLNDSYITATPEIAKRTHNSSIGADDTTAGPSMQE